MRHEDSGGGREAAYLLLGLVGLAAAAGSFVAPWPALPTLAPTPEGVRIVQVLGLVGSITACLVIEALLALWHGRPLGFLRKGLNSSVSRNLAAADVETVIEELATRASALGMSFRAEDPARRRWHLSRMKDAQVLSFRQHAFSGTAVFQAQSPETSRLTVEMTWDDTLLVDSGEAEELENLCRHLAGLPELPLAKEVSLLLRSGWALCTAAGLGTLALATGLTQEVGWLRGPAFVGTAILAISGFLILRKRDRLGGWKLILQGALTVALSFAAFSQFARQG